MTAHTPKLYYGEPPIEGKPYQFLGCHVVKWGRTDQPTMAFEVEDCVGLNPAAYRQVVEVLREWERNIPRISDETPAENSLRARTLKALALAEGDPT